MKRIEQRDIGSLLAITKNICSVICTLLFSFQLSAQSTLYSRNNGTWNNANPTTGTWSLIGPGGSACGCLPSVNDSVVIISNTITLSADADCKSLTIGASGTLFINNNIGLDINSNGVLEVNSGGTITHNGMSSNAHIDFESGTHLLTIASAATFQLDDIFCAGNLNLTINGSGDINMTDDFAFIGTNSNVTNNLSGTFNLTGTDNSSLWFMPASESCSFTNNGYMNIDRYLYFESDNNTVINNDTIHLTRNNRGITLIGAIANGTIISNYGAMFIEGDFVTNSSTITFNNHGLLDVNGNFLGFIGPGYVYNFADATIKWAGTFDNNALRLYCNYPNSTVVYDGTVTQPDIFHPQDNYVNITFENSGSKRIQGLITIKGNMEVNSRVYINTGLAYVYFDSSATLTINNGGSMVQTGGFGRLQFYSDNTYTMNVHDQTDGFQWQRITIDTNVNFTLNGDGRVDMMVNASIDLVGSNSTIVNNLTDTLRVDNISIFSSSDGSTITNNGNIITTGDLYFSGNNNTLQNNGSYRAGDDLLMYGSNNRYNGTPASSIIIPDDFLFNSDDNSVVTGGSFTLGDLLQFNASRCSLLINGAMTVGGTFRVTASNFDDNVSIINSGASLSIGSFMQLADADFVLRNSGIFSINGAFDDFGGNDSIINLSGGTINYAGIHNPALNTEIGLYCNYSASTFNYNRIDGSLQEILDPQDAYYNLHLTGSGIKQALNDHTINGNVLISGTAIFDVSSSMVDLVVGGGWDNSSVFLQGTEQVSFTGANSGIINGSTNTQFYDVVINKSTIGNALTTGAKVIVENSIDFINGIITTSAGNELVIQDNAICNEGNGNSYVSGPVQKVGDDPFVFPLGDNGSWARLAITDLINSPSVTDTFTAEYVHDRHVESFWDSLDYIGSPGGMKNVSIVEYWNLERNSGNTQPKLTLYWEDGNASYINDLVDLTLAHYIGGSSWISESSTVSGSVASGTIKTNGNLDVFSPFTFGSFSKGVNPLPVDFISFSGEVRNDKVLLEWATLSEVNNDHFNVERTMDGNRIEQLGSIAGNGNSTQNHEYFFWDQNPLKGNAYYRLKQVDYNGSVVYTDWVAINYQPEFELSVYPNPAKDHIWLKIGNARTEGPYFIYLRNMQNNIIKRWKFSDHVTQMLIVEGMKPGVYWLEYNNGETSIIEQVVLSGSN